MRVAFGDARRALAAPDLSILANSASVVVCTLTVAPVRAADDPATPTLQRLDVRSEAHAKIALQIWEWAERGFQEAKNSALSQKQVADATMQIDRTGATRVQIEFPPPCADSAW